MTTDEKILALVATGKFTMPEGLEWTSRGRPRRRYWTHSGAFGIADATIADQHAYDLCAMHFAREDDTMYGRAYEDFRHDMGRGDSEAAIDTLWKAVCGSTT